MQFQFRTILTVGAIVFAFVALLWALVCVLLQQRISNEIRPRQGESYVFDYVVVGAGTAGSVVAALLSIHSNASVLLIEAGGHFGLLSKIPLLTTFQQKGLNDWAFMSVPQKHSSKGMENQRQCLPRGKGLGGTAQLNYMIHFDGDERDFEHWSDALNLSDWRWQAVRPFIETARAKPIEMLEINPTYSRVAQALHRAEAEFTHKPWCFRNARYNIRNGLRYSVLQRLLQPAATEQRNLRIMTNAMVRKIELSATAESDGTRVAASLLVGIKDEQLRHEQLFSVDIRRELIVSAGAYQTPQLLLSSGIGDGDHLATLKIPSQLQLPQVGRQLHDHLNLPLFITIDGVGPTLNQRALLDPLSLLSYLTTGGGHLGNFGVLGQVFTDNREELRQPPFGLTLFAAGAIDEAALMSISNFQRRHFRALFPRYHNASQEGFVLISTCLQPKSRGSVDIGSANVRRSPLIDPNYLAEEMDVMCSLRAIRAAVELVRSEAFAELRPRIMWPKLKECANFGPFERDFVRNMPTDRYLECVLRHVGLGSHHPGGTCAMGTDAAGSVVDSHFRMHGVRNLRIIDASVLPTPISGNPNSIIAGLAVRGAAMILKEEQNSA